MHHFDGRLPGSLAGARRSSGGAGWRPGRRPWDPRRADGDERALSRADGPRRRRGGIVRVDAGSRIPGEARPSGVGMRLTRIWGLLRPYRWRVAGAVATIVVATAANLAPPYLAGLAVDDVIGTGNTHVLDEILLAMAGVLIVGWFAGCAQIYFVGWVGQNALRDLRTRLFDHLLRLSVGFYDRHSSGLLVSRMTNN